MYKVLLVDDHPIFRQGLMRIISKMPDFVISDEASNGEEALSKISSNEYDLMILDISMPGRSGLDIIREVRKMKPKLKILVLTIHPSNQYALRALKAGAAGYLTKEKAPDDLTEALTTVARGAKYVPSADAGELVLNWGKDVEAPVHETLSDREFQIMRMIATGEKVSDIARDLLISVKTVKTHRSRLMLKMKMKSNAALIHYAIKNHIVDMNDED
jgi:two-component system, NarL family, invasion response regulator UvrY